MTVRTRFIDEALERAIAGGATQVVILGAGFDSHAYRCQELLADVRVFEVDRPATQALKQQRVNDVLGGPPANLTYVAIDFQHEDLPDVLASAWLRSGAADLLHSGRRDDVSAGGVGPDDASIRGGRIRPAASSCSISSIAR